MYGFTWFYFYNMLLGNFIVNRSINNVYIICGTKRILNGRSLFKVLFTRIYSFMSFIINVKKIAFGNKEHTTDKKMGVSVLLRLFISSNEVCNTTYALQHMHEQNFISKDFTMGPMIPKEMKYNLHCKKVWICYVY